MHDLQQFSELSFLSMEMKDLHVKSFENSTQANLDYGIFSHDNCHPTNIRQKPALKRNIIDHADERKSFIRFFFFLGYNKLTSFDHIWIHVVEWQNLWFHG